MLRHHPRAAPSALADKDLDEQSSVDPESSHFGTGETSGAPSGVAVTPELAAIQNCDADL